MMRMAVAHLPLPERQLGCCDHQEHAATDRGEDLRRQRRDAEDPLRGRQEGARWAVGRCRGTLPNITHTIAMPFFSACILIINKMAKDEEVWTFSVTSSDTSLQIESFM